MRLNKSWLPYLFVLFVTLPSACGFIHRAIPTRSRSRLEKQPRLFSELNAKPRISMPHCNLAVSIDEPLLGSRSTEGIRLLQSFVSLVMSDLFKAAVMAFVLACSLSIVGRSSSGLLERLSNLWKTLQGQTFRVIDRFQAKRVGVPMKFNEENDGWGVCTLRSKKNMGRSGFIQYEFDLPQSDNEIPLKLGQQVSLCCLDQNDSVAKGDFYPYQAAANKKLGKFSIITPNKAQEDTLFALGEDSAHFVKVLKEELKVGDEIALKPGVKKLEYQGHHLPVTNMVYIAVGTGIAPILDQVRAVLPDGSSSVKFVSVVWINETKDDFDGVLEPLKREYLKHSKKLAVCCVADDLQNNFADNEEISGAIPDFAEGTMAVLSGPNLLQRRAAHYLITKRGYPAECICEL